MGHTWSCEPEWTLSPWSSFPHGSLSRQREKKLRQLVTAVMNEKSFSQSCRWVTGSSHHADQSCLATLTMQIWVYPIISCQTVRKTWLTISALLWLWFEALPVCIWGISLMVLPMSNFPKHRPVQLQITPGGGPILDQVRVGWAVTQKTNKQTKKTGLAFSLVHTERRQEEECIKCKFSRILT